MTVQDTQLPTSHKLRVPIGSQWAIGEVPQKQSRLTPNKQGFTKLSVEPIMKEPITEQQHKISA